MKALSVMQPWASLIASGRKTVELRTWSITPQRVRFCAGQKVDPRGVYHGVVGPRGVSLCDADVRCRLAEPTQAEADAACVPLDILRALVAEGQRRGRPLYAWDLSDVTLCERAPVSGKLGLFAIA